MTPTRLIFATGGSGGHIYPALAVAELLAGRGYEILFVGQEGGMEARIVPKAGFPFVGVRAGKWARGRPDPRQGLRALLGLWDAVKVIRSQGPAMVVGFGGFASFPALAAAGLLHTPIVLHEQNAYPGRVVRWFAGRARLVALASGEAARHLPAGIRTEEVGLPIRETRVGKAEARRALGLPEDGLVTFVMGGSQGSVALNQALPAAFLALPETTRERLYVLHSSGSRWQAQVESSIEHPNYRVLPYVDTTLAWPAADVAVTRAGMGTLAEAAFHGVPLLMVPLPTASENHQLHNAQAVESAGAGRVVLQADLNDKALQGAWQTLLEADARAKASEAARKLSPEGAARRLAERIEALLEAAQTTSTTASRQVQESK